MGRVSVALQTARTEAVNIVRTHYPVIIFSLFPWKRTEKKIYFMAQSPPPLPVIKKIYSMYMYFYGYND